MWEQTIPIPPTVSDTFTLYPCRKIRSEFSFHPTSPRIPLSSPPRREKFVGFSFLFPKEKVHKKERKKLREYCLSVWGAKDAKDEVVGPKGHPDRCRGPDSPQTSGGFDTAELLKEKVQFLLVSLDEKANKRGCVTKNIPSEF